MLSYDALFYLQHISKDVKTEAVVDGEAYTLTCPVCGSTSVFLVSDSSGELTTTYRCSGCTTDAGLLDRSFPMRPTGVSHFEVAFYILATSAGVFKYVKEKEGMAVYDGRKWIVDDNAATNAWNARYNSLITQRQSDACKLKTEAVQKVYDAIGRTYTPNEWAFALERAIDVLNDSIRRSHDEDEMDTLYDLKFQGQKIVRVTKDLATFFKQSFRTSVLETAKTFPQINVSVQDFDTDPLSLNVTNGLLDLRTMTLRPHDKVDLCSRLCNVDYDPRATNTFYDDYLKLIFHDDTDLIDYIHRAAGYSLTGKCGEEKIFLATGKGSNGKTTLLNTWRELLGGNEDYSYVGAAKFSSFSEGPTNEARNDLAALQGKRWVIAAESKEKTVLDMGLLKSVTGSEPVPVRFLFHEYFNMKPTFKIWLLTNWPPVVKSNDRGTWRRLSSIPFHHIFEESTKEVNFENRILAQGRAGILNRLLEGYVAYTKDRLKECATVKAEIDRYRSENDLLGMWTDECCDLDPAFSTDQHDLYKAYVEWCESNRMNAFSQRNFTSKLQTEKGVTWVSSGRTREYNGIRLKGKSTTPIGSDFFAPASVTFTPEQAEGLVLEEFNNFYHVRRHPVNVGDVVKALDGVVTDVPAVVTRLVAAGRLSEIEPGLYTPAGSGWEGFSP